MALTRIFFTSDVHGSDVCFLKFLNSAKFYQADILILGGDITGKMIVPILEQADGTCVSEFLGNRQILRTMQEREVLEKKIRNNGYYPYLTTPEEMEKLRNDKKLLDELFSKVMADGVKRWVSIAEERLKESNVKCYISPGNDDRLNIDDVLKSSPAVLYPEDEVVWLDDYHEMITTAWTNPTPWHSPRETTEETLAEIIHRMSSKVERMENCIFNLHCPPYGTLIDLAPELDDTLKPKVSGGGGVSMIHVGSSAVRQAIEENQPLVGIHGHIHESRGFVKIGQTLCINPGSEYGEGILRGVLINLDEKHVKSHILTQG
ncbi:MAG: metallophosphoesterase [Candidatus Bathyarchaeia archaeon]